MKKYFVRITRGDRYGFRTENITVEAQNEKEARKKAISEVSMPGDEFCAIESIIPINQDSTRSNSKSYDDIDDER